MTQAEQVPPYRRNATAATPQPEVGQNTGTSSPVLSLSAPLPGDAGGTAAATGKDYLPVAQPAPTQAVKRMQARHLQAVARYQSDMNKPPTRQQARTWLDPIRKAFREMATGEMDAVKGYAITRLAKHDEDYARVDYCINGFTSMLDRLSPEFDASVLKRVAKKLGNGVLIMPAEVQACFEVLKASEDLLMTFTRAQLKSAANTEMIAIEFDRMGLTQQADEMLETRK